MESTLAQIERALSLVEERLGEPLALREMARAAGMSPWHFHRTFAAIVGDTPGGYLRRRRLGEACRRLVESAEPIASVALASGFESQATFTRAFTRQMGVSPGRYRRDGVVALAHSFPPIDAAALLARLERKHMEPRMEDKQTIHAIGMAGRFAPFDARIPALWSRFVPRIGEVPHRRGAHTLGICIDDGDGEGITYAAAVEVEFIDSVPDGMIALSLPARRYAVWTHRGSLATFADTMKQVFGRWLGESKLPHASAPDFEWYDERFDPASESGEIDIYVPIESVGTPAQG